MDYLAAGKAGFQLRDRSRDGLFSIFLGSLSLLVRQHYQTYVTKVDYSKFLAEEEEEEPDRTAAARQLPGAFIEDTGPKEAHPSTLSDHHALADQLEHALQWPGTWPDDKMTDAFVDFGIYKYEATIRTSHFDESTEPVSLKRSRSPDSPPPSSKRARGTAAGSLSIYIDTTTEVNGQDEEYQ